MQSSAIILFVYKFMIIIIYNIIIICILYNYVNIINCNIQKINIIWSIIIYKLTIFFLIFSFK